jgi:hypothetical protein
MHPLTSMDAIDPQQAAERVALVRDIMIGVLFAFVIAGLPTWLLYGFLLVLSLSQ